MRESCIFNAILTLARESMGKSEGDGMQATRRQKRASSSDVQNTQETASDTATDGALQLEADRLREELAAERQRTQHLESSNDHVAARLDAVIKSVKAILGKQG